jgi:dTDP-4-dehydrorhamnose reductase
MKKKIIILGAGGMLGSMVLDVFSKEDNFSIIATVRNVNDELTNVYPGVEFRMLDVEHINIDELSEVLSGAEWIINAIGVINSYIHEDNPTEIERAVRVNALFPYILAKAAQKNNAKVIQIATDCVYKCDKGKYSEKDVHDSADAYGKTKSIGEAFFPNVYHLRCSIIGPERKAHLSLLDWFLTQKNGMKVNGFKNHIWNGVTSLHFSKFCLGIINNNIELGHLQHVIPSDKITKLNLLKIFAKEYNRNDIVISPVLTPKQIDRTLTTDNIELNKTIWEAAGYKKIPIIKEMVSELSRYEFKDGKQKD